ncbi:hypothetical protein BKA64DRAFT_35690 [Cadophora sp. MPI-SDFR-AT-0126]|nr:hypothetical protein BKA64DRAFT_35690 [Leotiomycetes sp. MPI-SDFR-AT-0126]
MLRNAPRSLEPLISSLPFWVDSLDLCRISIEGIEHIACIDNQASCSILSLEFALKNHIAVEPVNVPFTLGDGSLAYATGRALVNCIARGVHFPSCEFYILPYGIQPIILGRPFLYESGLLRCPRHTGHEALAPLRQKNMAIHPVKHHCTMRDHQFQSQIRIQIGLKEAQAVPDKASNQNFMSLAYAQALGYSVEGAQHSRVTVKLANGARVQCHGHIETQFKFRGIAGQCKSMRSRFTIIDGHPFDLSLGNPFVKKHQVFDERISDIEWTHVDEENLFLCPTFGSSKGSKGFFARKLEFTNDYQDEEMTGIASRPNNPAVISRPAVAAPQMPVAPAVEVADAPALAREPPAGPPGNGAQRGAVNHEPPTVSQSDGHDSRKEKCSNTEHAPTLVRKAQIIGI